MFSMTAVLYNLQGTLTTIGLFGHYNLSMGQAHPISYISPPPPPSQTEARDERRMLTCLKAGEGLQKLIWGEIICSAYENERVSKECGGNSHTCPRASMFPPFPSPLVVEWALWVVKASELGAEVTRLPLGHRVFCTYQVLQHSPLPSQEQGRPHVEKVKPGLLSQPWRMLLLNAYSATESVRTFMELIPDVSELLVFTAYPSLSRILQRGFLLKAKGKERRRWPSQIEWLEVS